MDVTTIDLGSELLAEPAQDPPVRRMKVLAAEDNPVFQSMLRTMLTKWGYNAVITRDGNEAWDLLQGDDTPRMAILDWG